MWNEDIVGLRFFVGNKIKPNFTCFSDLKGQ